MLDEFLGGAGTGSLWDKHRLGGPNPSVNMCPHGEIYLLPTLRGVMGQSCPPPAKSEGLPRRMAQTSGPRRKQGVISAYLRYE